MKYQLVILGPGRSHFSQPLTQALIEAINDLGLDSSQDFETLDLSQQHQIEWNGLPVLVWLGGIEAVNQDELELLDVFIENNFPVFPIVNEMSHYPRLVPTSLHTINGQEWELSRVTTDILRAFRLVRHLRQAFISYRRTETRAVAVQLFAEFSKRGYRMFLDTASVESGVDFQEALWSRMADVDLLVFLDSPGALSSRWVHDELNRAQNLGLGFLQLVWPGHNRTKGTEFCDYISLDRGKFINGTADVEDRLNDDSIDIILSTAETSRIRSLNSRRMRVVADFVDQAKAARLEPIVHPVEGIDLHRNDAIVASVIPVVGVPDAHVVQQQESRVVSQNLSKTRIVYTGLGVDRDYSNHLEWLNQSHNLRTITVEQSENWLKTL